MDQKLRNLQWAHTFLRYHRYACILAAILIIVLCVGGAVRHPGRVQENMGMTVLGIGCCVFSGLVGTNQLKMVDRKIEQIKARLNESQSSENTTG